MVQERVTPADVRRSTLAGTWYPADPNELAEMIDSFLDEQPPVDLGGRPAGLIVPHAGYIYSGGVAAAAYRQLRGLEFDLVVLAGPSHHVSISSALVTSKRYYETPFGVVEVDRGAIDTLARSVKVDAVSHDPEHSLEIQLPFLQRVLGRFRIVPLALGSQDPAFTGRLAEALASLLQGKKALLIASSDLSHFHRYDEARDLDQHGLELMTRMDTAMLDRELAGGAWEACGSGAISAVITACRALGAGRLSVLRYANSGDVTGDHTRVVGYGACAVVKAD